MAFLWGKPLFGSLFVYLGQLERGYQRGYQHSLVKTTVFGGEDRYFYPNFSSKNSMWMYTHQFLWPHGHTPIWPKMALLKSKIHLFWPHSECILTKKSDHTPSESFWTQLQNILFLDQLWGSLGHQLGSKNIQITS